MYMYIPKHVMHVHVHMVVTEACIPVWGLQLHCKLIVRYLHVLHIHVQCSNYMYMYMAGLRLSTLAINGHVIS